jgi:hypothetical protein
MAEAYNNSDEQSSETSVKFYQTTWHYILEDSTFYSTWVSKNLLCGVMLKFVGRTLFLLVSTHLEAYIMANVFHQFRI